MVARGEVDAAAIDSNVLKIRLGSKPELGERLRIIESWGPFPIQPVVLRSHLDPELKDRLRAGLLTLNTDLPPVLASFGLERFAPVTYKHYASEEQALRSCERTLTVPPL
jgi:phosphonate transport system substrate-binding protein